MRLELTHIANALEYASSRDPLTGAVNWLVLADRMAQAFARQRRHDLDVLVAVIDVDKSKHINDTYGHDAGDEVLIAIAQRLSRNTRPEDTIARLGSDEFAVVAEMVPSGGMAARESRGTPHRRRRLVAREPERPSVVRLPRISCVANMRTTARARATRTTLPG